MSNTTKIRFEKVTRAHLDTIFNWLNEPHIINYWDNSQEHKDDIIKFADGRQQPSCYADGKYIYWIASVENEPFAMLMTIQETTEDEINQEKFKQLSKTGNTYSLDFMIGNITFLNKGYGSATLSEFIEYFRNFHDKKADTFFIDPAADNKKALHVYIRAGFKHVCDFMMEGDVSGAGKIHHLLIKRFIPSILIRKTAVGDIDQLSALSKEKRLIYENAQPQFWRYAGEMGDLAQIKWFEYLLSDPDYILLSAEDTDNTICGFIIGKLMSAPPVYDPGGLTLIIDDFCVGDESLWETVGSELLQKIRVESKQRGASQVVVVSGHFDDAKRQFLQNQNLSIASEWYVGSVL